MNTCSRRSETRIRRHYSPITRDETRGRGRSQTVGVRRCQRVSKNSPALGRRTPQTACQSTPTAPGRTISVAIVVDRNLTSRCSCTLTGDQCPLLCVVRPAAHDTAPPMTIHAFLKVQHRAPHVTHLRGRNTTPHTVQIQLRHTGGCEDTETGDRSARPHDGTYSLFMASASKKLSSKSRTWCPPL